MKKSPLCFWCNASLYNNGKVIFAELELPNGFKVKVHKSCLSDAQRATRDNLTLMPLQDRYFYGVGPWHGR